MNRIDKIKELVSKLNYYRDQYYNHQNSEISDFEYDNLYDQLINLEQETGFILANSPTQTVGYEVKSELTKVKHNHPMLSLDKTKSIDDILKFAGDRTVLIMDKMDGLTCSLRYLNGSLVSAETRGNGEIGEDVLSCAKTIKNIPLHIDYKDELIVDGEVIITYDDFDKINSVLPEEIKYKNPRNLASASIRLLDSSIAAKRNMKFIAWKCVTPINGVKDWQNNEFHERLAYIRQLGFDIVSYTLWKTNKVAQLPQIKYGDDTVYNCMEKTINLMREKAKSKGYPIDGLVISYINVPYLESLGATNHHLRGQLAFKFYDDEYETTLQDIEWTMGKTGILTPTAIFEPVEIDGTMVERASLHNISIMKKLFVGAYKGQPIKVYKANMIIPQISWASPEYDGISEMIWFPTECSICHSRVEIVKENESEVLICTNDNCLGKLLGKLSFFVSKKAMDIDGLSEATIEFLINKGWVKKYKDLYHLDQYADRWARCEGFGKKSVEKILNAIEKSRNVDLAHFITALSIPGVGSSAAKLISEQFNGDFDTMVQKVTQGFDFTTIEGFGETTNANIQRFFYDMLSICDLANEMHFVVEENKEILGVNFEGLNFCITGSLTHFANRDALVADIESHSGKFVSSVSAKCNYLINNDSMSTSSKNKKAQSLNIPIITEEEYLRMCGD